MDSATEQCTATCKATKARCRRWVRGGGPCHVHGGKSPRAIAAREKRLAVKRAEEEAAKAGLPYVRRHPGEVLLDAVMASDVLLTHLLRRQAEGALTAEESLALGLAVDRAARTSRSALDAQAQERWVAVQERITQRQADQLIALVDRILADGRLIIDPADKGPVVIDALKAEGLYSGPVGVPAIAVA